MHSMKNKCVLAGFLAAVMMLLFSIAFADTATVNVSSLILRQKASTDSKALQTLPRGTELEIKGKSGSWYKVTYGKYTGYVFASYVKVNEDKPATDETLKKGDTSADVRKLQERLQELGYFTASRCTTYFGDLTKEAVEAFQKNNGLTVDGIAGPATLKKLYASSAKKAPADEQLTASDTLSVGARGDAVEELQKMLIKLDYLNSSATGYYGEATQAAVKAFQKKNGLTANGVANKSTIKKIEAAYDAALKNDKVDGLTVGDRSDEVKALQTMLIKLDYLNASATGYYGDSTQAAVKAFQKKNGLTASGVATNATIKKIEAAYDDVVKGEKADGLTVGDRSDEVKALQQMLIKLDYLNASATGYYGESTQAAVKAFQKKNGLTASGVATNATIKKIEAAYEDAVKSDKVDGLTIGSRGDEVKELQTMLIKLDYLNASATGYYGESTQTAVKAFQKNNGLIANGIASDATIKKIKTAYSVLAEKEYKTERLDWFKNGRYVFPRTAIIQVKDVRTGLIFNAKVLYGSNHLDAEPLTKEDTKILLKINGGVDFSWRRRPMLVKYNGHVYAASIYSEPHGDQTIYNNDFDGQFCLHFYGSKTHGSDRVDPDHQACVAQAMYATW